MLFAMPELMEKKRREDHKLFYCPSGHEQYFPGKTDLEKAREELAQQKQRREQAEAQAAAEREAKEKAERALRRTKQRVGAGSCPCCKRHFKALSKHMATKHPAYKSGGAS